MPEPAALDYTSAFRYAATWAVFAHANIANLVRDPHAFHGTLGSLDFAYAENDHTLHVWAFVMPGAGPFVTKRPEVKATLDQIAQQHPEETAGAFFDIGTLDWNRRASPELEPCLRLRLDVMDSATLPDQMVKRFDHLSTTGFQWNRHKMAEVLRAYWKAHPQPAK